MKLSEIVTSLNELKQTVASWVTDKTKATAEAIGLFQSKLSTLESGAVSELTQATSDLATAKLTITNLQTEKASLETALTAACAAVKIEDGNVEKITAMAPAAKITALQTTVSNTLAKLNVDPAKIPNPSAQTNPGSDAKTMKRAEFFTHSPKAQAEFVRAGGRVID